VAVEGLESSVAWSLPGGQLAYCLQGGVFTAGALLDWLSRVLGIASGASELDELARAVPDTAGVRILPALSGLGAPWWRPEARAVIAGLTASSDRRHIARAALDGIAQRVCDVVERIAGALPDEPASMRVDGGLTSSSYLLQRQADLLGLRLELPASTEATALGMAGFAGLGADLLTFHDMRLAASPARVIEPSLDASTRAAERAAWRSFVEAASAVAAVDAGEGRREVFA
jgi:glycerol kinase